jgi:hypothetical protein
MVSGEKLSIEADWYEVGTVEGSDDVSLSLRAKGGGFLRFNMDRLMAERLLETLQVGLGGSSGPLPPGTSRN